MAKFRDILKLYRFASKQRDEFYNVKWRLAVAALIVITMWLVNDHLSTAYPTSADRAVLSTVSGTVLQASERMFNWFVTGFLVGFLAFALMIEGEFIIATSKLAHKLAEEVGLAKPRKGGKQKANKRGKR